MRGFHRSSAPPSSFGPPSSGPFSASQLEQSPRDDLGGPFIGGHGYADRDDRSPSDRQGVRIHPRRSGNRALLPPQLGARRGLRAAARRPASRIHAGRIREGSTRRRSPADRKLTPTPRTPGGPG